MREPDDRQAEDRDAAVPVRENAGDPTADRREQQCGGCQRAGLRLRHRPQADERRHDDGIELHVHRVERPPGETGRERPPFADVHAGKPVRHGRVLDHKTEVSGIRFQLSARTSTLRNLTTPAPYCSANGPRACLVSMTSAVLMPLSVTVRCDPCARISYVFHLPPALIGVATLATLTMPPVP